MAEHRFEDRLTADGEGRLRVLKEVFDEILKRRLRLL
jgi:hypothetical protein